MNAKMRDAPASAVTMELNWLEICEIGFVNPRESVRKDAIIPSVSVFMPVRPRFGVPAIAFSQAEHGWRHLDAAAETARRIIAEVLARPPSAGAWLLNVNIPARPDAADLPRQVTRLGRRHASEPVVRQFSPRGDPIYWIGAQGEVRAAGEGTDFHAVAAGIVSVTPLQVDLTDHAGLPGWQRWLAGPSG